MNLGDISTKMNETSSTIKYNDLCECERIMCSQELLTTEEQSILQELRELKKVSRFQPTADYYYDLVSLIGNKPYESCRKIRAAYFPEEEYDSNREV